MSRLSRLCVPALAIGAAVLLAIVLGLHKKVLPSGLATQIGHNSEALCFAVIICALFHYARPVVLARARPVLLVAVPAVVLFGAGLVLIASDWPAPVRTLNEALIGAALVWVYGMLPRPLRWAPLVSVATLVLIVVFFRTDVVIDQAESLVPFLLAPIALDVVDRPILEPEQPERPVRRLVWMVLLLAAALGFMAAAPGAREDLQGALPLAIDYGQRAAEAYWGWLLIHAYFWILAPSAVRRRQGADRAVVGVPST